MAFEGIRRFFRRLRLPEEQVAWEYLWALRNEGFDAELHPRAWHQVHVSLEGREEGRVRVVKRAKEIAMSHPAHVGFTTQIDTKGAKRVYKVAFVRGLVED